VILARQDEHETLETLFKNVDLSFAYNLIKQCFHASGPGRPPRNPAQRIGRHEKAVSPTYFNT
jgi:hypothetical protein